MQILLDFRAIRFKFHDRINQTLISFQSVMPKITQGNKRFCASWWSAKLCPNSNKRLWSTQGAYFRSHARLANQHVKISQGLPIDVPNYLLYFSHTQHHVQKARGSRSMLHTVSITFSMRVTVYEKKRAPNRCSIQLLLLLARVLSRMKSKELPIDAT
jgi:hypothetical protein